MKPLSIVLLLLTGCVVSGPGYVDSRDHRHYTLGGDYAGRGGTEYEEYVTQDGRSVICISHPYGWTCHVK